MLQETCFCVLSNVICALLRTNPNLHTCRAVKETHREMSWTAGVWFNNAAKDV